METCNTSEERGWEPVLGAEGGGRLLASPGETRELYLAVWALGHRAGIEP